MSKVRTDPNLMLPQFPISPACVHADGFSVREGKMTKCRHHTGETHSARDAADVCCRGGSVSRNFRIPVFAIRNILRVEFEKRLAGLHESVISSAGVPQSYANTSIGSARYGCEGISQC